MKTSITLSIILASIFGNSVFGSDFELPKIWPQDYTIHIYHDNGRSSKHDITFTADSCIYARTNGAYEQVGYFKVSEKERAGIIKKLKEFKIEQIKASPGEIRRGYDKSSTSMCFMQYCLSDDLKMTHEDFCIMFHAYEYLQSIAEKKTRFKK